MSSPETLSYLREIWVFGPGGYREPVANCGLCHPDTAEARASALRLWLRCATWDHGTLPPDLLGYPDFLRGMGVDPAQCRVAVLPANMNTPGGDNGLAESMAESI